MTDAGKNARLTAILRQALALQQNGRLQEAESLYRQVLRAWPRQPDALHFLGLIAHQCGREAVAVDLIKRSIELTPANARYHNNLGGVYQAQGDLDAAAASYARAIALAPDYAEAHNNLGMTHMLRDKIEEAVVCFERAVALNARFYQAHAKLGDALRALGRTGEAVQAYRCALAIEPDNAQNQLYMGLALRDAGRDAEAHACFERALALKPNYIDALLARGLSLGNRGELDAAADAYRRVLEIRPDHAGAYFNLAGTGRLRAEDAKCAGIARLAANVESLSRDDALKLHFALGKLRDEAGAYDEAFRHWRAANRLKRQTIDYDGVRQVAFFKTLREYFSRRLSPVHRHPAAASARPVFIIGMPRSGTTLVEQIIASHPQAFGAGEFDALPRILRRQLGVAADEAWFAQRLAGLDRPALSAIGDSYLDAIQGLAPAATCVVTNKLLSNIALVGLIALVLPRARIVFCRRDPLDTCLSCYATLFTAGVDFAYDLVELARHYRNYAALAEHWRQVLPAQCWLDVRYEDVVSDSEAEARRIVAHCGLEWNASCLRFYAAKRVVKTSSFAQVRRPLYRASIGRWRHYAEQLAPLRHEIDHAGIER